jgi:hypothetical protein
MSGLRHPALLRHSRIIKPMFLWTRPELREACASRDGAAGLLFRSSRRVEDRQSREYAVAPASASAPSRAGKVMPRPRIESRFHRCDRNRASRNDAPVAAAMSSALEAPSFNHSQAGFWSRRLASPAWRQWAAAPPTSHQETSQCPTKCSSMRPIRRRPGWLCCAANA